MRNIGIILAFVFFFTAPLLAQEGDVEAVADTLITNIDENRALDGSTIDISKTAADSAYMAEQYTKAIDIYEQLLKKGVSHEIYYNLGNSYYKKENIAKALLNYERAVLLSPNNRDYKANLEIARLKTVDKYEPTPELFFISWAKSIVNWMSSDQWAITSITLFILGLVALGFFFLTKQPLIKRIAMVATFVMLLSVPVTNYCASYQKKKINNKDTAIVMEPSVTVRSTPSETGTTLFVIHEGKKVNITDASMTEWLEIELENGEVGWLPKNSIEVI